MSYKNINIMIHTSATTFAGIHGFLADSDFHLATYSSVFYYCIIGEESEISFPKSS
jgi:flagellar assembly factor FliW